MFFARCFDKPPEWVACCTHVLYFLRVQLLRVTANLWNGSLVHEEIKSSHQKSAADVASLNPCANAYRRDS